MSTGDRLSTGRGKALVGTDPPVEAALSVAVMPRHEEHERIRQRLGVLAAPERSPGTDSVRPGGASTAGRRGSGSGWRSGAGGDAPPGRAGDGRWDSDELDDPGPVGLPDWLDDGPARRRRGGLPARLRGSRWDPGRRGVAALGVVGVLAVVVTALVLVRDRPVTQAVAPVPSVRADHATQTIQPGIAPPVPVARQDAAAQLVVSVVGMVARTGLQRLPGGARVADAIEAAGGALDGADLSSLNLAQRLTDGDQIVVGASGPSDGPPRLGSVTIAAADRAPGPSGAGTRPSGSPAPAGAGRVNLNTAGEAELDALPGVGPVTAKAIVAHRTAHGPFTDVAQLGDVDGIGPARLAKLRDLVTL